MTYAILYTENGDLLAERDSFDDARFALHEFVAEHPGLVGRVAIAEFDDDGHATGEFHLASELEAQPA